MAAPVVNVTAPTAPLAPGSVVEFTWTVLDADNRTIGIFEPTGGESEVR